MLDSKKRFSNRVEYYIKYRPSYPKEILSFLKKEINFTNEFVIADVGSGTGILSELFLKNGNKVFCIEPNKEMKLAAEACLENYKNFVSINGSAEATALLNNSVNFITAGQAFHWFDVEKSKKEFLRILKPGGFVCLIWNSRKTDSSEFLKSYEKLLLTFAVDYKKVDHKNVDNKILNSFFKDYQRKVFPNSQKFIFESLIGRLLSSS